MECTVADNALLSWEAISFKPSWQLGNKLRLLKYSRVQYRLPLLPAATHKADLCRGQSGHIRCFNAGDKRVNEQPGLIALHTIWLRAHNKIATELSHINPHWRDEKLYQETRRIIGALMQHITFKEFLPIVLGRDVMRLFDLELMRKGYFNGYDIKTNPTAANAFGTAAFRFGHSLVQHSLVRCDRSHKRLRSNVSLHEELTNPSNLYNIGSVDRLLLGLCQQPAQKRDEFITEELTNRLFQTPRYGYGMDLAALNIQRGRDHGLAPYTAWREPCGLQSFTEWSDLLKVMSAETQHRLKRIYRDLDDIDLFPGGMAERPVSGGLVGPTFACILAQQFSNVRKGDRFWYENGGFESSFTLAQLQQIRRMTLARILCDNLDGIDTLQPFVFLAVDSDRNHRVPCDSDYIPYMDLKPWAENHKEDYHEKPTDHEHSPSYQKPSYPQYQKPVSKPSYQESTRPSYVEHKPSYLIDFGSESSTKPNEQHKPSYLIDNNFQGKPTKPQNFYRPTTSKYPKPQEEHKPTYLIEESFQQSTKRPHGGYRPTDSAFLPLEHKDPYHNHNNYDTQLPSKLETKPNEDYNHHHYHHSTHDHVQSASHAKPIEVLPTYSKPIEVLPTYSKPQGHYPTVHQKPQEEYPLNHHESLEEHSSHHTSQAEYHPNHHKPHDEYHSSSQTSYEYPSYSNKPQDEHSIIHNKPHDEYPSNHHKPNEEQHLTHHKPNEEYHSSYEKPQEGHSHHKPYDKYPSYSTKPQYEYTTSKPHYGHQTQSQSNKEHYKPQYLYTFTLPLASTTTSKPHYGQISFTNSYGNGDIPSTLDYNKYKPKPNPSTGTYTLATKPPSMNHYNIPPKRPSYGKPSSIYQHESYNYIKMFNEPSYYYLEDGKIASNVSAENTLVVPHSDWNTAMPSDSSALKLEPRTPTDGENIPTDEKIDAILTTSFDTARSENKEIVDIVTIEGSVVNINIAPEPEDSRKITVTSNKINIAEDTTNQSSITFSMNNLTYLNIVSLENITESSSKEINTVENSEMYFNLDITNTDVPLSTVQNDIDCTSTTIESQTEITATTIQDPTETITDITITKEDSINTTPVFTEVENNFTVMEDADTTFSENTTNTPHKNEENNAEENKVTDSTDEAIAFTSNYVLSTSGNSEYDDEWLYVEEVENDSIIPEMPVLISDPMALKELPRPMIFEDEESSRTV
ncbi:hypothetical protein C0J52_13041 [Blattella germanica]|nr:hypothetical protein C0J52_13041 [Blattella germanica]